MRNRYLSASLILLLAMANATPALAQSFRDKNARILKPYLEVRPITALEWDLLQFNLSWQGAYDGNLSYLTSSPVFFEPQRAGFAPKKKDSESV